MDYLESSLSDSIYSAVRTNEESRSKELLILYASRPPYPLRPPSLPLNLKRRNATQSLGDLVCPISSLIPTASYCSIESGSEVEGEEEEEEEERANGIGGTKHKLFILVISNHFP